MIRSSVALEAIMKDGRTVARLCEMDGATKFRWVLADTNEPVHGTAINRVVWKGCAQIVATDICGDPIQLGASA